MQLTRTRTKYYLLSVLGALAVAVGLLAMAPSSAQAQAATADKECIPNPVQIGQQLVCTIDVEAAGSGAVVAIFVDTFPAGVTPTSAAVQGGYVEWLATPSFAKLSDHKRNLSGSLLMQRRSNAVPSKTLQEP